MKTAFMFLVLFVAMAVAAFGVSPLLMSPTVQQAVVAPPPSGGTVKLSWQSPTNGSDIVGFRVKVSTNIGTFSNQWQRSESVGMLTNATVNGLAEWTTNWFVVVSVSTNGVESIYSNITNRFVPPKISMFPRIYELSAPVRPNITNYVDVSTNTTSWLTVLTNRNGNSNGVMRWFSTNDVPQRFYRVR